MVCLLNMGIFHGKLLVITRGSYLNVIGNEASASDETAIGQNELVVSGYSLESSQSQIRVERETINSMNSHNLRIYNEYITPCYISVPKYV